MEPIYKTRAGKVQGAVWANDKKSKDGNTFKSYSATITKQYKKGENYEKTDTYFENEITDLIVVATDIQKYIKLEAKKQ